MINHLITGILFLLASFGIITVLWLEPSGKEPFYVHAYQENDTITVRFSSQTVYVLDYHPVVMRGNLRHVGTVNAINETKNYTQYNTTVGDFTLYYEETTPTALTFRRTYENHAIHYKILP